MAYRHSYVMVTAGRPVARPGRHRLGTPGTAARYPSGPPSCPPGSRRARHRRAVRPATFAVRSASLVVLLGTVAVSGWFAAVGATAFAQMVQP